ncbi:phosphate ABC transporter permease subunit PstC [Actinomadura sp. NPDC048955]|uniref:Phosphate transport system permease protein n=1 Tax=Actinomadura luteofluorescens TaxID=46163 RepID=A0A7Y9EGG4_9ACTN|nr:MULTISPECIES: phosphate ABC transporter permease subunit PstC [Actinomadura]MCR3740217.1 phosphate transport system permease protein [Actinomadura glauciflava]NYD47314.1 phosphate transport system permease protein [Actinomadura luteofluorescens]
MTSETGVGAAAGVDRRTAASRMSTGRAGDKIFVSAARGSGIIVLLIMAAIAVFLVWKAVPALQDNKANFLTAEEWNPNAAPPRFGIAQLAFGTVVSSLLAMLIATPVAVGIALFISFYSPRRLASGLGYVVDLLAAVPSIVYGLWGLAFLSQHMEGISKFLNGALGWIPLFGGDSPGKNSIFTASVVLSIMILPIISSISREVFLQVPRANVEAALALGATRWETIRLAVLPYGRSGMIGGAMLGLGRAMGETIAVAMVLTFVPGINIHLLENGGATFASNIANSFAEASSTGRGALIASGLVLFVITLLVNMAARAVVARRKEFV